MSYLFSHEDKTERERLAAIEAGLDPFTIDCLQKIGVGEGWRCLEIGAGAGSIAKWLCGRVGPNGRVVVTDLQTKFLEAIDCPNLEVRKHDMYGPDATIRGTGYLVTVQRSLWVRRLLDGHLSTDLGALCPDDKLDYLRDWIDPLFVDELATRSDFRPPKDWAEFHALMEPLTTVGDLVEAIARRATKAHELENPTS